MNIDIEKLKQLHMDVFQGNTDYIPLIVNPPCPGRPDKSDYWNNIKNAVKQEEEALLPKLEVGSDWIPTVNVSVYQNILIPALYDAKLMFPGKGSDPVCHSSFVNIDDFLDKEMPGLEDEFIEKMVTDLRCARKILSNDFYLSFVVVSSPFELAFSMIGGSFLMGLIETPDKAHQLLDQLTKLSMEVIQLVNNELNYNGEASIKSRGIFSPGFRLACDSIVNLSPEMLREFVLPVISTFRQHLGPMYIHYCTEPAPSSHILPILLESEDVIAVDNWQGPDIFMGDDSPAQMQSQIAIIGDIDLKNDEDVQTFFNKNAVRKVPRKGGRGLIMTTPAKSVDKGKQIHNTWRDLLCH